LQNLAGGATAGGPVLLTGRANVKTARLIVVGSDRGLCGGLNANLLKAAKGWVVEQQALGRTVQLVAVGRKIRDGLKSLYPTLLVTSHTDMGKAVEVAHAQTIADEALKAFMAGEVDNVQILYSALVSMLTQTPTVRPVIPFSVGASDVAAPSLKAMAEYEPTEEEVLEKLLPLNLTMQVFSALLETQASEHAARMSAMDSATRNAGEMIKKLSLVYNRSRQATITKELIEIISGAEAL
jgi:F-type H+-transporting ATPase subunit gamma